MSRPYNNYDSVVMHTLQFGGGTFLLPRMYALHPAARVYCLSLDDDRGIQIPIDSFDMTRFTQWCLNGNEAYIEQWNSRGTNRGTLKAIGTWIDEDDVYIDVSSIISKDEMYLSTVMELARVNNQRAIWDNELQVALETGLVFA